MISLSMRWRSRRLNPLASVAVMAGVLLSGCAASNPSGQNAATESAAPPTVEEQYAKIAALGLSEEDLERYLYERALLEGGSLVMYGTTGAEGLELTERWSEEFARRYPGLDLVFVIPTIADFTDRVLAEHRSGRPQADIVHRSVSVLAEIYRNGLLAEHYGVLAPLDVPEWSTTSVGVVNRVAPNVIPWRTDRNAHAVPETWDDFLRSEFSGCVLPDSPTWFVGMVAARGVEGAEDWLERFLANGGQMALREGTQFNRLLSGEIECVVQVDAVSAETARFAGAPIDWSVPPEAAAVALNFSVLKTSPRPHSAALFIRWAVGLGGSRIAAELGSLSVHPMVELRLERMRPWQDPSSPEFRRTRIIGVEEAATLELAARELIERWHAPNVTG
jgi:ABC-type Fe3+ transport system substrate-binding protein